MSFFKTGVLIPGLLGDAKWKDMKTQLALTRGQDWTLLSVMADYLTDLDHAEMAAALRYCAVKRYAPRCSETMKVISWMMAGAPMRFNSRRPWHLARDIALMVEPLPGVSHGCRCKTMIDAYVKIAYARRSLALALFTDHEAAAAAVQS